MFKKFKNYIRECIGELKKVTWPKKEEIVMTTGIVIAFIIVITLFLGFIDIFAGIGINWMLVDLVRMI